MILSGQQGRTMLNLTQDFRAAATGMAQGMAYLTSRRNLWLGYPVLDLAEWSGTTTINNCYNFALNRNTGDWLQPGMIGMGAAYKRPPHLLPFLPYSLAIYRGVEADGLRDLGHDFAKAATLLGHDERPVALFMSDDCSYHWMALWRSREDEKNRWSGRTRWVDGLPNYVRTRQADGTLRGYSVPLNPGDSRTLPVSSPRRCATRSLLKSAPAGRALPASVTSSRSDSSSAP